MYGSQNHFYSHIWKPEQTSDTSEVRELFLLCLWVNWSDALSVLTFTVCPTCKGEVTDLWLVSVLCCLPSDSRSPALLCVRRWSVWNKRWSRRGRSNACWRSNYETPSGRARTQRTATGFWRRRWRISSPRWEIWPWVQGLVTFNPARPRQGLYFGVRCLTRARVLCSASGRSFIWKVKKKKKIGELDNTCVHSGQIQTERWSWRMQISNWKWPSPSPRSELVLTFVRMLEMDR